jgi:inosose dehydratase
VRLAFSAPTTSASEQAVLFSNYRECGYEGLQLKAGQYLAYLDDQDDHDDHDDHDSVLPAAREDPGRFSGLIFGGSLDETGQQVLRKVLDFAARVRSERVIFCHGLPKEQVTSDDIRRFGSVMSKLGTEAQARGTRLSLHHHYGQPVMFPDDISLFFKHVDPGSVGLTIDTAHMWMAGQDDVGAVVEQFAPVLDNVHLKDCRDDAPGERLTSGARRATTFMPLGQGELDFGPVFRALSSSGYSGWLCVDEESGADIGTSLKLSHRFVVDGLTSSGPPPAGEG